MNWNSPNEVRDYILKLEQSSIRADYEQLHMSVMIEMQKMREQFVAYETELGKLRHTIEILRLQKLIVGNGGF